MDDPFSRKRIETAMQKDAPVQTDQMRAAAAIMQRVLGCTLVAVYLHGSAVSGGLRPQSDIDLLAVSDRSMTQAQRHELLRALMRLSGHHPATAGTSRCIETMVFIESDLAENCFPPRADFVYGEWLRDQFEAGGVPVPTRNPEHTLVLAQARKEAVPLIGPAASALLPEIPPERIRSAMGETLPALLQGLRGDERNVLLTLARMWRTAKTGEFVTKDTAAAWAIPHMSDQDAATLDYARKAYLGQINDEWDSRHGNSRRLAEHLCQHIVALL